MARAVCYSCALAFDIGRSDGHVDQEKYHARGELLTPVAKAFSTDIANEVASLSVQVHGGMGFIEETGAAQYYRDSRITAIYEGTNGIQAIDLVGRKIGLAGGETLTRVIAGYRETARKIAELKDSAFGSSVLRIEDSLKILERTSKHLIAAKQDDALAGATPYLRIFGLVAGGAYLAEIALAAHKAKNGGDSNPAHDARIATARFFAENLLPAVAGLEMAVMSGADSVLQSEAALVA